MQRAFTSSLILGGTKLETRSMPHTKVELSRVSFGGVLRRELTRPAERGSTRWRLQAVQVYGFGAAVRNYVP